MLGEWKRLRSVNVRFLEHGYLLEIIGEDDFGPGATKSRAYGEEEFGELREYLDDLVEKELERRAGEGVAS